MSVGHNFLCQELESTSLESVISTRNQKKVRESQTQEGKNTPNVAD